MHGFPSRQDSSLALDSVSNLGYVLFHSTKNGLPPPLFVFVSVLHESICHVLLFEA